MDNRRQRSTNQLLVELYNAYKEFGDVIGKLKKLNISGSRMPNFPKEISEMLPALLMEREGYKLDPRKSLKGDFNVYINGILRKIEVKCFSSTGPISFGPTSQWYQIYFIDAIHHPEIKIYKCKLSSSEEKWQNIKVNRTETFGDQANQKRRPRIVFNKLEPQIPLELVYKGNLVDFLLGKKREIVPSIASPLSPLAPLGNIRFADFFAGVGGIRLGFHQASNRFECVYSNEIDKNAISTYTTNFSGEVDQRSITDIPTEDIPDFDLMIAGFPCQSFSQAGNRKGFEDARGNLFFELVRILKEKKPKAFLFENVKNLKTHDLGATFTRIRKEIIDLGYTFRVKILNSESYGNTPQNRERIFLVGFLYPEYTREFRFPKPIKRTRTVTDCLEENIPKKYFYTPESTIYPKLEETVVEDVSRSTVYQYRRYYVRKNTSGVCPTLTANMGSGGHNVPIVLDLSGRIRKLTPRECFNLQTFPKSFELPKIADSHLYKQVGNSVTVNVVRRIAVNILKVF